MAADDGYTQLILVRTRTPSAEAFDWARQLATLSGAPAVLLVDTRQAGALEAADASVLAMTRDGDRELNLYAPADVGWRCGDYGFYAARARFPNATHFWMIEDDVRIGGDGAAFFAHAARFPGIDFLASCIRPAEPKWWWYGHATSRDAVPWRSFFPVTRLSGVAVDRLLAKRRHQSRLWTRRALWPNDEAFVATTIAALGLSHADLNALGPVFYYEDTFGYDHALDPAEIAADGPPRLLHPVLNAAALARRNARRREADKRSPLLHRAIGHALKLVNSAIRW